MNTRAKQNRKYISTIGNIHSYKNFNIKKFMEDAIKEIQKL